MAKLKTIILWGQSNAEGDSEVDNLTSADLQKYFGVSAIPASSGPGEMTVPGVNIFQVQMPVDDTTGATFPATVQSATPNTLTVAGTPWTGIDYTDQWIYVVSGTGVGAVHQIASNTDNDITIVDAAWSPATPVSGDTFYISNSGTNKLDNLTGAFQTFRLYYDDRAVNSYFYSTGYEYPASVSVPKKNPNTHESKKTFGPELELTWSMQQYLGEQSNEDLWVIKLAIPGSYASKFLGDIGGSAAFSWFESGDTHNDWHPTSGNNLSGTITSDLFDILFRRFLTAAKSWVTTNRVGDEMDVIGVFSQIGESDAGAAASATQEDRARLFEQNMRRIRDSARDQIVSLNVTSSQAGKIPWIMGKTQTQWEYAGEYINPAITALVEEDLYTGSVETEDIPVQTGDVAHFTAAGQVTLGRLMFEEWLRVTKREDSASTPGDGRPTLAELRTRVRRRYERNDVSKTTTNAMVDNFINDSLAEIYYTIGDNAWFLRRIESITINGRFPNTASMPKPVRRLLILEHASCPGERVPWKGHGYDDEGRLQITIYGHRNGPYNVHHMIVPKQLEDEDEKTLLPEQYCELLVMLTCKRFAETSGNQTLAIYYNGEVQRLYKYVKRDCQRYDRHRQEQFKTTQTYSSWGNSQWPSSRSYWT